MLQTANYGFLKPEDNENFDQQAHANQNMDSIDAAIKAREDAHAAHLADYAQQLCAFNGTKLSGQPSVYFKGGLI